MDSVTANKHTCTFRTVSLRCYRFSCFRTQSKNENPNWRISQNNPYSNSSCTVAITRTYQYTFTVSRSWIFTAIRTVLLTLLMVYKLCFKSTNHDLSFGDLFLPRYKSICEVDIRTIDGFRSESSMQGRTDRIRTWRRSKECEGRRRKNRTSRHTGRSF